VEAVPHSANSQKPPLSLACHSQSMKCPGVFGPETSLHAEISGTKRRVRRRAHQSAEIARLERKNASLKQLVADQALAISLFKKLQRRDGERR